MILFVSCCGSKKSIEAPVNTVVPDTVIAATSSQSPADTAIVKSSAHPECINKLIESFKAEDVQNPPRKVYSYLYKGKTVYYVPAICCDFFSDVYDSSCNLLGHPDGGFTGKGDGTMTDFEKEKSNEKLVWADPRKR